MKTKIFSAFFFSLTVSLFICFTGCSQDTYSPGEGVNSIPENISSKYVAPSGDIVFVDDEAFVASTTKVLTDIYGDDMSKCSVTDISFSPSSVGYVASIEYLDPMGEESNYVMTNIPFTFEGGKLELEEKPLKYRNRLKSTNGPVKIKSLAIIPVDGNYLDIKAGNDIFTYSCKGNAVVKYDIR
ncbi:MAG: hypothetical protein E6767_12770 [Dysgonomonas sp.]|nr:hypothetical protein [Dysgonomonas sp.]